MDTELVTQFREACDAAFGFLVDEYGFQPGVTEVDWQIRFVTVRYFGKNLAVECVFDERERWVDVNIARVVGGRTAPAYPDRDAHGRLREGLVAHLLRKGVRNFGPRVPGLASEPVLGMFQKKLSIDAGLLRKHGASILEDSFEALDD